MGFASVSRLLIFAPADLGPVDGPYFNDFVLARTLAFWGLTASRDHLQYLKPRGHSSRNESNIWTVYHFCWNLRPPDLWVPKFTQIQAGRENPKGAKWPLFLFCSALSLFPSTSRNRKCYTFFAMTESKIRGPFGLEFSVLGPFWDPWWGAVSPLNKKRMLADPGGIPCRNTP